MAHTIAMNLRTYIAYINTSKIPMKISILLLTLLPGIIWSQQKSNQNVTTSLQVTTCINLKSDSHTGSKINGHIGCKSNLRGKDYTGTLSVSGHGVQCKPWLDKDYNSSDFPDSSIEEAASYCRNPDNRLAGPWCYITANTSQHCTLPVCLVCLVSHFINIY